LGEHAGVKEGCARKRGEEMGEKGTVLRRQGVTSRTRTREEIMGGESVGGAGSTTKTNSGPSASSSNTMKKKTIRKSVCLSKEKGEDIRKRLYEKKRLRSQEKVASTPVELISVLKKENDATTKRYFTGRKVDSKA